MSKIEKSNDVLVTELDGPNDQQTKQPKGKGKKNKKDREKENKDEEEDLGKKDIVFQGISEYGSASFIQKMTF